MSHETGDALQQRSCRFNSLKFKAFTSSKHPQLLCSVHLSQFFSSSFFKGGNSSSYLSSHFSSLSCCIPFFIFPKRLFFAFLISCFAYGVLDNTKATATIVPEEREREEGGFNHKMIMSAVTCAGYLACSLLT